MTDSILARSTAKKIINDLKSNKTPVWVDDIVYTEDLLNAYLVTIVNTSPLHQDQSLHSSSVLRRLAPRSSSTTPTIPTWKLWTKSPMISRNMPPSSNTFVKYTSDENISTPNNFINVLKSITTPAWIDDIIYTEDLLNAYHVTTMNKSTAPGPVPPFLFDLSTAGASHFVNKFQQSPRGNCGINHQLAAEKHATRSRHVCQIH
jgi:hypothetical protein